MVEMGRRRNMQKCGRRKGKGKGKREMGRRKKRGYRRK
jgi:hypothetical protein